MIAAVVGILLIVCVGYALLYSLRTKETRIINLAHPEIVPIKFKEGETHTNARYTHLFWLKIDNINANDSGMFISTIMEQSDKIGNNSERVNKVSFDNYTSVLTYEGNTQNSWSISIKKLPLQKWNHVALVNDGFSVHIYVDGKLEATTIMTTIPEMNSDDSTIKIGNQTEWVTTEADDMVAGNIGHVGLYEFKHHSMSQHEVLNDYVTHYNQFRNSSEYKVEMELLKNNKTLGVFSM